MNAFAFDDDYAFGVLTSRIHTEWARVQSSTLEDRIRYTPSSAFETFPWPEPDDVGRTTIAEVASGIVARRHEICMQEGIGLTALYNAVDDGAWVDLAVRHRRLDEAVAVAYDWPREIAQDADQTNRRLLDLNREIAAGARPYNPF